MRLSELKTGEKGVIVKVLGHGGFRKRIVEMGFIKGKTVEVLLNAPLKDPIKYKVMGYEISLRRQEAGMIEILSEHEAKEQVTKPNYHPGMSEDIYPGEEELKRIKACSKSMGYRSEGVFALDCVRYVMEQMGERPDSKNRERP